MIDEFNEKYRFLSNFYLCTIDYESIRYPSVEHAYQAAKTKDMDERLLISKLKTPGDAKRKGRRISLRVDWEEIKLAVMENLLREKFFKHPLKEKLLETGTQELREGNWWGDKFWGVDSKTQEGQNHLGKLLMKIREELRVS